jgi:hypothetical protein
MAATLQYGRERAHLGRSLLNFMRIARNAHTPGEVGDLLFTAIEVFIGTPSSVRWSGASCRAISKCRATTSGVSCNV